MDKRNFKKELKHLYQASGKVVEKIEVPSMNFLMVDGEGDPNTSTEYVAAIETLYSVAYTSKANCVFIKEIMGFEEKS